MGMWLDNMCVTVCVIVTCVYGTIWANGQKLNF